MAAPNFGIIYSSSRRCLLIPAGCVHLRSRQCSHQAAHSGQPPPRHPHTPVLVKQVIDIFKPKPGQVYLDMTFGAGGHTRALLEHQPHLKVFVLDRDPIAYSLAKKMAESCPQVIPLHGKFSDIPHLVADHGVKAGSLDGVLLDVGASSMQFDDPARGFSLSQSGPLDMRMDRGSLDSGITAGEVVNFMDEIDLTKILKNYGEEKKARLIARAIVDHRYAFGRLRTTKELADIVTSVYQSSHTQDKLQRHAHVATKTFQALRIFVNDELNELYNGIMIAHRLLRLHGKCIAISFHSLEDRIVKRSFHGIDMDAKMNMSMTDHMRNARKIHNAETVSTLLENIWEPIQRGVIEATDEEVSANPRSRSAKLRAAIKMKNHS